MSSQTPGNAPSPRRMVLMTGMSGAGMSSALKTLEDLGYEAVDNLPQSMIDALVHNRESSHKPLAIGIDSRNADFNPHDLLRQYEHWRASEDWRVSLTFLECSDGTLLRRFSETRRRHPLAIDRPIIDGIQRERELMQPLLDAADHVIDTSRLSIHDLRRLIVGHYRIDHGGGLSIFVTSFAFRHGLPREADLVFDARFLINPHWETDLRPMTGRDQPVADYIARDPDFAPFMNHVMALITPLLPRFMQEGKSYLTIAVGCTGGKHRSVLVVEKIAVALAAQGYVVSIGHRDIGRASKESQ